jgi:hypothetical protein
LLQDLNSPFPVLVLTPFFLVQYWHSSGDMSGSTGTVCFVDSLASGTTWSCVFISHIFLIEGEIEGNSRHDNHWGCWGMQTTFGLCLGDSDNFMYSWLAFHDFVHINPSNFDIEHSISFIKIKISYGR